MAWQTISSMWHHHISRRGRYARAILLPLFFGMLGFLLGRFVIPGEAAVTLAERDYPLPHHIPKYPGNLTLRFAMVYDVIHERFPHHGPDYYRARNQSVKEALKTPKPTVK